MKERKPLGELLVDEKTLTNAQLNKALEVQRKQGGKLGEILIALGYLSEHQLALSLSKQLDIPYVDLQKLELKADFICQLPESYARRYMSILLEEDKGKFVVAMADPSNIFAYDEIARILQKPIKLKITEESNLIETIDLVYRHREEITGFAEELSEEMESRQVDISELAIDTGGKDAPVVKLLQSLFTDAVSMGASDIHIEPDKNQLRIRQRIDGDLQETIIKEKRIIHALTLRLKLMAGLNIAERRMPQDGRFSIKVKDQSIDVRISTMPIQFGEGVVMRLLNQSQEKRTLTALGVHEGIRKSLQKLYQRPYGMILVTGPTGSGKTTTLYSVLDEINVPEKKIITVEDPVEYRISRISQVQVNELIDLTFSRVLHSALRHDPDIMMIGEIRDNESATIALRAAMTGHLVLATLHTNDAISSALRLVGMGVDSFLVATALNAVLAQRLVKRVCDRCKIDYKPLEQEEAWLRPALGEQYEKITFKSGEGCSHCNNTGYRGRIGAFELLVLNKEMITALHENNTGAFYSAVEKDKTYKPLGLAALELAVEGITTISEVARIAGQITDEISRGLGIKESK